MNDPPRIRTIHVLALIATALVLALAGCGGDDDGGDEGGGGEAAETQQETTPGTDTGAAPAPEGDEAAVEETVRGYANALAEGDGEQVCSHFTAAGRRELDEIGGCADFFSGILSQLSEEQRSELREIDPTAEVNGDRATATVPSLEGEGEDTVNLRKEGGEWKIADTESPAEGP